MSEDVGEELSAEERAEIEEAEAFDGDDHDQATQILSCGEDEMIDPDDEKSAEGIEF